MQAKSRSTAPNNGMDATLGISVLPLHDFTCVSATLPGYRALPQALKDIRTGNIPCGK